ncbi:MAG: HisA/HisF-related TIM barrel protein, partial [Succinivibrio sp.]
VTDISRDGMMKGANNSLYAKLKKQYPDLDIIASGGISSLDDVKAVRQAGAESVVLGRALLEGRFTVEEAVKCWQNA